MNIGDIIAQKGIVIRGNVVVDKAPIIASIIKSKMHRAHDARARVVHTTIAKPHVVRDVQVTNSGLFKDEMERLGNIKERQDNRIPLGTRHMRFKNKEFSFSEAMCVTKDSQLRRLGRIPCNFDNIEMKATNRSK
jgi:hypothetical protein